MDSGVALLWNDHVLLVLGANKIELLQYENVPKQHTR
jgi:hypothetical protein